MNKTVTETSPRDMLKQLALEFISSGYSTFKHWETVKIGGSVHVYSDVKSDKNDDYYISISAEFPKKCKFLNEITVSATCFARKDDEDVLDCKLEYLGLTKKQLAAFIKQVKLWSLDYK
ncbi:MAG: hypothetical protein EOM59_21590 [Clostridia bacterium]|nr:hypothetical protein [Clostridia bacterium]